MAKTFSTMVSLQNYVESACSKAVKETSNILVEKLKDLIQTRYYDLFDPNVYIRTEAFLRSAVANMIDSNTASIGIDEAFMDYQYPANYRLQDSTIGHWTGEDQANMAERGYHGTYYIHTDGHYWSEFVQWCDKNAISILRENLIKAGLTLSK